MEAGGLRPGDPERLGSYDLVRRLGEGGQGVVFLGRAQDGREVAVKLLHADLTADEKARARFVREVEVAKAVAGFCTAQVLDVDTEGDRPYIVSEYVTGPSLHSLVQDEGPLTEAPLDRLAVGTATALVAIHQADIVHRDFKPHNVLIGPDGPRVIDFGISRAISGSTTLTSRIIGTPSYMAPEQLEGGKAGKPVDVFCWAATIVYAATGKPPFGQDSIPAVINRILHKEPELGELTGPLRAIVADCLAKDPEQRPQARDILMRLLGEAGSGPSPAVSAPSAGQATEVDEVGAAAVGPDGGESEDGQDRQGSETAVLERATGLAAGFEAAGFEAAGAEAGPSAERRPPSPKEWARDNTIDAFENIENIEATGGSGRRGGAAADALPPLPAHLAARTRARGPLASLLSGRPAALAGVGAVVIAAMAAGLTFAMQGIQAGERQHDGNDVPAAPTSVSTAEQGRPADDESGGGSEPVHIPRQRPITKSPSPGISGEPSSLPSAEPSSEPSSAPGDPGGDPTTPPDPGTGTGPTPTPGTGGGSGGASGV